MFHKLKLVWRSTAVLLVAVIMAGCATTGVRVNSRPSGATVLLDGNSTGQETPTKLLVRGLPTGRHTITVEKQGYKSKTPPRDITVRVAAGEIFFSVLLAAFVVPKNLCDNLWKHANRDAYRNPPTFELEKSPPALSLRGSSAIETPGIQETPKGDLQKTGQIKTLSTAERLKELKELKDNGILTEQEYETKRKALVDQL